jgi:hypothetical protein
VHDGNVHTEVATHYKEAKMARQVFAYQFRVTPVGVICGSFPFDMLRYDGCYPATGDDAARMTLAPREKFKFTEEITLEKIACTGWKPGVERWRSFGWNIVVGSHRKGQQIN